MVNSKTFIDFVRGMKSKKDAADALGIQLNHLYYMLAKAKKGDFFIHSGIAAGALAWKHLLKQDTTEHYWDCVDCNKHIYDYAEVRFLYFCKPCLQMMKLEPKVRFADPIDEQQRKYEEWEKTGIYPSAETQL